MTDLLKTINPMTRIETEEDARAVARASSLGLWLSAARFGVATASLIAGFDMVRALAETKVAEMPAGTSVEAVAYGIVAGPVVIGLVEVAAGVWQWKRPGVVVPIIWLLLLAYGLYAFVSAGASLAGMGGLIMAQMLISAILHASGLRGALALARFKTPEVA
jgi:hypothetical protein